MGTIDVAELPWTTIDEGDMQVRRKQLAPAAGGREIGCSLYELPAGTRSWPYHYHTGNEEAIYVLEGSGTVRLAGEAVAVEAGTYVALPAASEGAHRVVNDSEEVLRYLMVSTMREPDVTVYPDSEKIGVYAGTAPGGAGDRTVEGYFRRGDDVDYWRDEPGADERE